MAVVGWIRRTCSEDTRLHRRHTQTCSCLCVSARVRAAACTDCLGARRQGRFRMRIQGTDTAGRDAPPLSGSSPGGRRACRHHDIATCGRKLLPWLCWRPLSTCLQI
jgi:hypothetical protein